MEFGEWLEEAGVPLEYRGLMAQAWNAAVESCSAEMEENEGYDFSLRSQLKVETTNT